MPRVRRKPLTAKERLDKSRLARRAKISSRYIDPTPEIDGTEPEKIVINRLLIMGIPFYSQAYLNINIPELDLNKDYRPDILIPDVHIIIQIQGSYWHSKPAQIDADAYLNALYETVGYRVLDWWDYDIMSNLDALIQSVPEFANWTLPKGGRLITGLRQSNIDDSKGIVTLNKKKARGATAARVGRRKLRKSIAKHTKNSLKGTRII